MVVPAERLGAMATVSGGVGCGSMKTLFLPTFTSLATFPSTDGLMRQHRLTDDAPMATTRGDGAQLLVRWDEAPGQDRRHEGRRSEPRETIGSDTWRA